MVSKARTAGDWPLEDCFTQGDYNLNGWNLAARRASYVYFCKKTDS